MMKSFIPVLLFLSIRAFGQDSANKLNKSPDIKPIVKVEYVDKQNPVPNYACFVNGIFANRTLLKTLDIDLIDSLSVVKYGIKIDDVQYPKQIHVRTKSSYSPKLISLTDLKNKYTDLGKEVSLFMIDGNIVNGDYDTYLVDEDYVMALIVDKVENPKNNIDLNVIKLVLKTKRNMERPKDFWVRGEEISMNR